MKFVLLAALVAFVCYVSILDPVAEGQAVTTKATTTTPAPKKNKTCHGKWHKKRPTRGIGGSINSAAPASGGGGPGAMVAAAVKSGEAVADAATAAGKKIQKAVGDGIKSMIPKKSGKKSAHN
ncbi:uncharacterized protein LOC110845193 [Folsomia candida]|uniref:Uncharacterized protein n=1 Tax=Folsomia candida TaxID=158441 RepID=A0A226ETW7_FOLCA|nr:uncharacterized protein LOC110845193 [Folsomia candida]OXA60658.1 hypothetical protein Fcan01_04232 [Folsomia candida]